MWYVYIVECKDGTYYTGMTTNIKRRLKEHNGQKKGAKYTSLRRPVKLIYSRSMESRSAAMKEELRIKKSGRKAKERLILDGKLA